MIFPHLFPCNKNPISTKNEIREMKLNKSRFKVLFESKTEESKVLLSFGSFVSSSIKKLTHIYNIFCMKESRSCSKEAPEKFFLMIFDSES